MLVRDLDIRARQVEDGAGVDHEPRHRGKPNNGRFPVTLCPGRLSAVVVRLPGCSSLSSFRPSPPSGRSSSRLWCCWSGPIVVERIGLPGIVGDRARWNDRRAVRARLGHPRGDRRGARPAGFALPHVPRRPRARPGRVPAQPPAGPVFRSAHVLDPVRPGHRARPSLWVRACGGRAVRGAMGIAHTRGVSDRPGASPHPPPSRRDGGGWHRDHRHARPLRPCDRGRLG